MQDHNLHYPILQEHASSTYINWKASLTKERSRAAWMDRLPVNPTPTFFHFRPLASIKLHFCSVLHSWPSIKSSGAAIDAPYSKASRDEVLLEEKGWGDEENGWKGTRVNANIVTAIVYGSETNSMGRSNSGASLISDDKMIGVDWNKLKWYHLFYLQVISCRSSNILISFLQDKNNYCC